MTKGKDKQSAVALLIICGNSYKRDHDSCEILLTSAEIMMVCVVEPTCDDVICWNSSAKMKNRDCSMSVLM